MMGTLLIGAIIGYLYARNQETVNQWLRKRRSTSGYARSSTLSLGLEMKKLTNGDVRTVMYPNDPQLYYERWLIVRGWFSCTEESYDKAVGSLKS